MRGDLSDNNTLPGTHVAGGYLDAAQRALDELLGPSEPQGEDGSTPYHDERSWDATLEGVDRTVAVRDRPVWLRVWDHPMSPGTRYRLLQKMKKLEKPKTVHHQTRRKNRRAKYLRSERASKLKRDKWLQSCPEGLYMYYKRIAKQKGIAWRIGKEEFIDLLYSEYEGTPIYQYIFNIYRIDKDRSIGYSIDNIYIKDRYSNIVYYTP